MLFIIVYFIFSICSLVILLFYVLVGVSLGILFLCICSFFLVFFVCSCCRYICLYMLVVLNFRVCGCYCYCWVSWCMVLEVGLYYNILVVVDYLGICGVQFMLGGVICLLVVGVDLCFGNVSLIRECSGGELVVKLRKLGVQFLWSL